LCTCITWLWTSDQQSAVRRLQQQSVKGREDPRLGSGREAVRDAEAEGGRGTQGETKVRREAEQREGGSGRDRQGGRESQRGWKRGKEREGEKKGGRGSERGAARLRKTF